MSKEEIEALYHEYGRLNLKVEKPKFHKVIRQPGRERLVFLQNCLSQVYGGFAFKAANKLEEEKELEEEIMKRMAALGISQKRTVVTGTGSQHENLLFWKRLLFLIDSHQSCQNTDLNTEWKKSFSFMTELLQHPQLEKELQSRKPELSSDFSPENRLDEDLLQAMAQEHQSEYYHMEDSLPLTYEEQEWNNSMCQRLQDDVNLLQERLAEFKEASKSYPRMENSPSANLTGMCEALKQQCTQLEKIGNFFQSVEKIESAMDFLTSIEPPDVTATESENLLFNNTSPDLLNGLH